MMTQLEEEDKAMKEMDEWVPTFASRPSSTVMDSDSKVILIKYQPKVFI